MDLDVEYDNRARVPEHPAIFALWQAASAALRGAAEAADLGVPYGPGPRQFLDIVWPRTDRRAPVVLFLHGGYWRSLHPRDHTFAAAGCLAHGVAMAFAGYDLAPDVSIGTIMAQARTAAVTLFRLVGRPMVVCGHSAGGHLAAVLTATDWPRLDADMPADAIAAGIGISGVYDLAPLRATRLNETLRIGAEDAPAWSPVVWPVPPERTFDVFVGGAESGEFLRQSRDLAVAWSAAGVSSRCVEMAGANHFTVVDALADPASPLVLRLVEMARATLR